MSKEDEVNPEYELLDTDRPEVLLRFIFGGPASGSGGGISNREAITTLLRSQESCSTQDVTDKTKSGKEYASRQAKNFHGLLLAQFDKEESNKGELTRTSIFEYLLENSALDTTIKEFNKITQTREFLSKGRDPEIYLGSVGKDELDLIFGENNQGGSGWEFWGQVNWNVDWEDIRFNPEHINHFEDYTVSKADQDAFGDKEGFDIFQEYLNSSDTIYRIAKNMNPITVKTNHSDGIIERISSSELKQVHNIVSAPGAGSYLLTDKGKRFAQKKIELLSQNSGQICIYDGELPFSITLFMDGEVPVGNILEVNERRFGSEGEFTLLHNDEINMEWSKKFFEGYVESDYTTDVSDMDMDEIRSFLTSGELRSSIDF